MTIDSVRRHLAQAAPDLLVVELEESTATVLEAAAAHGVQPGQIAKTLSLRVGGKIVLVVAAGDARLDNRKAREALGGRISMLAADEVEAETGHPVGGVSPFGLAKPLRIVCDQSLLGHEIVIPAAGSRNSAIRIAPRRLAELVGATWDDLCSQPQPAS